MSASLFSLLRSRGRAAPWQAPWTLPSWQAHRGYHLDGAVENTLGALIQAARKGALMGEFDVRLTKDGVPVLFHDADLFRLTGRRGALNEITWRELKDLAPISSLQEVLRSADVPKYLNIELKSEEIWNDPLERKVADVIRRNGAAGRVLFSSFNPVSLWKMTSLLPDAPRALLAAPDLDNPLLREMALLPFLSLQALHLEQSMLSDRDVFLQWRSRGYKIAVWTVNDVARIDRLWSWGVDSVITDLIPD